jgi:hypothetical protein
MQRQWAVWDAPSGGAVNGSNLMGGTADGQQPKTGCFDYDDCNGDDIPQRFMRPNADGRRSPGYSSIHAI